MRKFKHHELAENGLNPTGWIKLTSLGVIFKIAKDKRAGVVRIIIKEIKPVSTLNKVYVFFVRDGFAVKKFPTRFTYIQLVLKIKDPIHSKNLGALFLKYNVPKTLRNIFLKRFSTNIHTMCLTLDGVRKFLPTIEDQVKFYSDEYVYGTRFLPKRIKFVKSFLNQVQPSKLISYMNSPHLIDTVRMVRKVQEAGVSVDFKMKPDELHDWAMKEYNKIKNPDRPIEYPTIVNQLEVECNKALNQHNLSIKFARSTYELIQWGSELSHCIGTYGSMAVDGRCILIGVFVGENLTYTIETNNSFIIRQFYGKRNSRPTETHQNLIKEQLLICNQVYTRSLTSV